MRYLFLILLLWAPLTWAQIQTESTIVQAIETQKADEAKKVLLHSAVLETIIKYSTEIGINPEVLNSKLQEKFNLYFDGLKDRKLTEKFGKKYKEKLSEEEQATFLENIVAQKEATFITFARLESLLDTYAFKSLEKDPSAPNSWKATIVMNINRDKVDKFYKRLQQAANKQFTKLLILPEINLLGLTWPDLGLDKSSSFTDPLLVSWDKWLSDNRPVNVEEIVKCQGSCEEEFGDWLQIPQEEGMTVKDSLHNGLWLRIFLNLRKQSFTPGINEWQFEWEGSVVLLDANTKLILFSRNISTETKTWRGLDQKELNSQLASAMYRSALDSLSKVSKKIEDSSHYNQLNRLAIQGHKHMGDVLTLMEQLKNVGRKLHLELKLDLMTKNEAQLLAFYQGEEKTFIDLLSGVKELKSSHSYSLVNEYNGVHHILKLVAQE